MNRDQLIQTATRLIAVGDDPGTDYEIRTMCFVGAIAKLLLAQTMPGDAPASTGQTCTRCGLDCSVCVCGPPAQHCTRCGQILLKCACGPSIMPKQDWEDPGEDENP